MDFKAVNIDNLGMSVRSTNALHRARIFTVGELLTLTETELAAMHNVGRKSIEEIMAKIRECSEWMENGDWPQFLSDDETETVPETSAESEQQTREMVRGTSIRYTGMSVRAINALTKAGIQTVGELVALTEDDLGKIKNLGKKTIEEILRKTAEYRCRIAVLPGEPESAPTAVTDPAENYEEWLEDENNRARVVDYLRTEDIGIDVLDVLSVKAYNLLVFAGYTKLFQIIFSDSELEEIPRMDSSTADEIRKNCRSYLRENRDKILEAVGTGCAETSEQLSVYDMIKLPEYRESILRYVRMNDLRLDQMGLSHRALFGLLSMNYQYLSDVILKDAAEFHEIHNLGSTSINEIVGKIRAYIEKHESRIIAFVNGDTSVFLNEDAIRENILKIYQNLGFRGLHLFEITEKLTLPEEVGEEPVKKAIGRLIAEGKLEYIDYQVYCVYPSFSSYLDKCDESAVRGIRYVRLKMQGQTLEAIAQEERITRERVRQIIKKTDAQIRSRYFTETGMTCFDEDYYRHLYTHYAVDRRVCTEWLGISEEIYNYLDIFNSKGKKNLSEALDDPELDIGLKLKIKNYLNRDKIYIDGCWIEKKRSALEDYVLMKFCGDEISFEDFAEAYNNFLASQGIPYTEDLYYTESVMHTRSAKLSESRVVLWKQFQKLRYYDIDARDYTELLDTLNLDTYENIELSTLKFMEDYPDLMERYDIRDQYELHNLLKKIVPEGSFHDFHCGRMPEIVFGRFDRDNAIFELLINNAPISQGDLIDIIHKEYGYSKLVIGQMLDCIRDYNHMGMYSIDYKAMPASHRAVLQAALPDDFYYIDEIKQIYGQLVPDADPEMVNPYNLKSMGFMVLSRYVLQHWSSLEAYFEHLLLDEDIVDLEPLYKKFGYITMWSQTLASLRNDYEILEFEPNQVVGLCKLEKSGITKQRFIAFCDEVYRYVEDGTYFSAKSLRLSGFDSDLYNLGFSDWFYANLISRDARFSYCNMLGSIILYKGKTSVSIKSFLTDLIRREGRIDISDLMSELREKFGCRVEIKSDITQKLHDSEIYYDPILERLYANIELYYRELDEDPEGII